MVLGFLNLTPHRTLLRTIPSHAILPWGCSWCALASFFLQRKLYVLCRFLQKTPRLLSFHEFLQPEGVLCLRHITPQKKSQNKPQRNKQILARTLAEQLSQHLQSFPSKNRTTAEQLPNNREQLTNNCRTTAEQLPCLNLLWPNNCRTTDIGATISGKSAKVLPNFGSNVTSFGAKTLKTGPVCSLRQQNCCKKTEIAKLQS